MIFFFKERIGRREGRDLGAEPSFSIWEKESCSNCCVGGEPGVCSAQLRAWNTVEFAIDDAHSSVCGHGPSCVGKEPGIRGLHERVEGEEAEWRWDA